MQPVVHRVREAAPSGLGLSIASVAELYEGVYYSTDPAGNERALRVFLSGVSALGTDEETCRIFATERGRLSQLLASAKRAKATD